MTVENFYRAFEDRHRGSRKLIMERLQVYLPYVMPLLQLQMPAKALDLGCGRGEWLQITQEAGFEAHGVDLDEGMLLACRERGLSVTHGDAIAYLQALPDESLSVVSGFHVAEHIAFEQLDLLVREALRALRPGGLLILETPNPENLVVGTASFYLDPSHQRPIPPQLLEFLPSHHGFARVKTLRLQEPPDLKAREDIRLIDVLHGVSPDYSVVSQKAGSPDAMAMFDSAFATEHGVELATLASRFDQRQTDLMTAHHETRELLTATRQELNQVKAGITQFQDGLTQALDALRHEHEHLRFERNALQKERDALHEELKALHLERDALHKGRDAWHMERDALRHERDALRNSLSWRVTAPLRGLGGFAASPISYTMRQVLKHPKLSESINGVLSRFPGVHAHLRTSAISQGLMQEPPQTPLVSEAPCTPAQLSPRAQQIHTALEQEIARLKA